MIEIGPSLHKVDYDTAWLYTATLTHKAKYDWRWPTLSDFRHVHNIPNPLWYQGYLPVCWHQHDLIARFEDMKCAMTLHSYTA